MRTINKNMRNEKKEKFFYFWDKFFYSSFTAKTFPAVATHALNDSSAMWRSLCGGSDPLWKHSIPVFRQ